MKDYDLTEEKAREIKKELDERKEPLTKKKYSIFFLN
jgi:hypothetical protein